MVDIIEKKIIMIVPMFLW